MGEPAVIKWKRAEDVRIDTMVVQKEFLVNFAGDTIEIGDVGASEVVIVGGVEPGKPAGQAGMQTDDIIVAINDIPVKSFGHMQTIVYPQKGNPVKITWRRDDQMYTRTVSTFIDTVVYSTGDTAVVGMIGISRRSPYEKLDIFNATIAGFKQSVYYVLKVFEFVWGLINREIAPSEIGGVIYIGKLAGDTARAGTDILFEFLALLSINLAILNLLPIPIFDGSHIVFLLWEKIKGAPPSMKTRAISQQIGLAFILILVVFVTFNDIMR
jgi:regulator of sigma E protease